MKLYARKLGDGQPLIIVHGLFGSSDNWLSLGRQLATTYGVWLVDMRNHGHSPHDPVITYEAMASDLFELLSEHGLRDVLLLGHSMGGKVVLRFAQTYGFLVDRMIVADIGIRAYLPHHDAIFRGLHAADVDQCPSRAEADSRLAQFVADETTRQFLLKSLYWKEPGRLAWRFNVGALEAGISHILEAIPPEPVAVPTLFLRGEKSNYITEADLPGIRALVGDVQFETIGGAGHWLHADAPEAFLEAVRKFLG